MKQVKYFKVPEQESELNDFLAKTPPESVSTASKGEQCYTIVNYDDNTYPDHYKAEEIRALMLSNEKESMTAAIARDVMDIDLRKTEADLLKAEEEVVTAEATEVPLVQVTEGKKKGTQITDYVAQKAQTEKVTALKQTVSNIKARVESIKTAMNAHTESIERSGKKNIALQKAIDALNLA